MAYLEEEEEEEEEDDDDDDDIVILNSYTRHEGECYVSIFYYRVKLSVSLHHS